MANEQELEGTLVIKGKLSAIGGLIGQIAPGGGSAAKLEQNVDVMSSASDTVVTPSEGYDGFSQVTVKAISLQNKVVDASSSEAVVVTPDAGKTGLSRVTVNKARLQNKFVNASSSYQDVTADSGYLGLKSVGVYAMALQTKEVAPSTQSQIISADTGYDALESVIVLPEKGSATLAAQVIPTGIFENALISKLTLTAAQRIEPGSMSGINAANHFDLYITHNTYCSPATASGHTGYPFGDKTDVTLHLKESVKSLYTGSNWEEFIYEHEGFEIAYDA